MFNVFTFSRMPIRIEAILALGDGDLSSDIGDRLSYEDSVSTVTPDDPNKIKHIAVSLVSLLPRFTDPRKMGFTHVCVVHKGQRVAFRQNRIKLSKGIPLPEPLTKKALLKAIPANKRKVAEKYFKYGYSAIPQKTGELLMQALQSLLPEEVARKVENLANTIQYRKAAVFQTRNSDVAAEKDAIGLSLDIFGARRMEILSRWEAIDGKFGTSFLAGLREHQTIEDSIIDHDLHNLPGWGELNSAIAGVAEFQNDYHEKLVIINANRRPLEKALGVDLIYFHRRYEAFTFVQYKMMDVSNGDRKGRVFYNPSERNHQKELTKMRKVYREILAAPQGKGLDEYRLSTCPFFFKLSKRLQFVPGEGTITPGAYIPLDQWELLLKHDSTAGPKGGRQIGYHNLGKRYIGTQSFSELVGRGFLGTQLRTSRAIGLFVESALGQGHSIIYSIDDRKFSINGPDQEEEVPPIDEY